MPININFFGKNSLGEDIHLFEITNSQGTTVGLTDIGASWVSMIVRNTDMRFTDVILGHSRGEYYENYNADAFGSTIGRNANRVSGHSFILNNKRYEMNNNSYGDNLHSGPDFYGTRLWKYRLINNSEGEGVEFSLFSRHMDQGLPGNLNVSVTYLLTGDNRVVIEYSGISDEDTVVNLSNHTYFNLNGHASGSIEDHELYINSVDAIICQNNDFSKAHIENIERTPMDFSTIRRVSNCLLSDFEPVKHNNGLDNNYCLREYDEEIRHALRFLSRKSGICLDIYTDRPGIQVYTANGLNNAHSPKDGVHYSAWQGAAFETQHYPDAVNHPEYPSPVIKAGERFKSRTIYEFTVLNPDDGMKPSGDMA